MTVLTADLLRAYHETHYVVNTLPSLVLRVGQFSPELQRLHRTWGVCCSAYLTACNPRSQPMSAARNTALMAQLRRRMDGLGLTALPGIGHHPQGGWPGEESLLVLGLERLAARSLAADFDQNGLLWSDIHAVPRLLLLR